MKAKNIFVIILVSITAILWGCEKDKEPMKWVDLRYDVPQDSYLIDKDGTETVTIRVKSTDDWQVFGKSGADWYTITPDGGPAGEIYTVTIRCEANPSLDDRSDIIVVKSDYWTGKEFTLTQKGTAYLEYDLPKALERTGEPVDLEIISNQDWTAEVTSGDSWLNITGISSGNGNETVSLEASVNSGEQRTGDISLYDRNGDLIHVVSVVQNGVVLMPAAPENENYHVLYSESQTLTIPVESNTTWTVSKSNPEEEGWFQINGDSSFEGNADLSIIVSEYAEGGGSAVRTGTLILTAAADEGITPVTKTIRFKQASPDANRTQTNDGLVLDNTGLTSDDGLPVGRYTFYLAPFTASDCIYLYFFWQKEGKSFAELRFWLNTTFAPMKTELSCMPYCNDVNKWQNHLLVGFDSTKQVKIVLDIKESAPDAAGNTWIYSEWWLNDRMIAHATSDGIADSNGASDTWKIPFADISNGGYFKIWAFSGSATLEKWEYTSPIVWGE
ncbi:MAG: hypothetical protein E7116_07455 [Bacteroidales bacterium]|nr:hypothetical protein [Bacteroidales bacterium]